jgi:DNA repair protein SbcC/Rad50
MLISLELKNFLKHSSLRIDFPETGMVAITGPNASGKSTILMAIRYALYGAAALNGKVDDIKGSEVRLCWAVRGATYVVLRKGAGANLFTQAGDTLAVGAKAVNTKIVELMGFSLSVFDAGVCANQSAIAALSGMKPAERKRLVDETLGLSVLENIAKWCAEEATGASREAEGVRRTLRDVGVPPTPPSHSEEGLKEKITQLNADLREHDQAKAVLAVQPNNPGPAPSMEFGKLDYDQMDRNNALVRKLQGEVASAERSLDIWIPLARLHTEIPVEEKHLPVLKIWIDTHAIYTQPLPYLMPLKEIEADETRHAQVAAYHRWKKLHDKGSHTCPSCAHSWPVAADEIAKLGNDFSEGPPPAPAHSLPWLDKARHDLVLLDQKKKLIENAGGKLAALMLTHPEMREAFEARYSFDDYTRMLGQHEAQTKVTLLNQELFTLRGKLSNLPRYSTDVMDRCQAERQAHRAWTNDMAHFAQWQSKAADAIATIARTQGAQEALEAARELRDAWAAYRTEARLYATSVAERAKQDTMLAELDAKAEEWRRARDAMTAIRSRVKGFLVPSLSAAASVLLNLMTGGRRCQVVVTEDFEVTVDGQPVETLSGSEEAAANLALRVAMGQVLTARVFPIFMADEPDAAMDNERAALFAQTLRGLDKNLRQIVLVTHKATEADLVVELS